MVTDKLSTNMYFTKYNLTMYICINYTNYKSTYHNNYIWRYMYSVKTKILTEYLYTILFCQLYTNFLAKLWHKSVTKNAIFLNITCHTTYDIKEAHI